MTARNPTAADLHLRTMERADWPAVAELIFTSTNSWYTSHGRDPIFACSLEEMTLFCSVYEGLDPGCCLVIEDRAAGRIAASCFYHPRSTHVSLGIMNVHPDYVGRGLAGRLLQRITASADERGLPVRLVSSAINLDSFSLYTRQGFAPRAVFQDLILAVPPEGMPAAQRPDLSARVRLGRLEDLGALVALERELCGIERERDFRAFLSNAGGVWRVHVLETAGGDVGGFLVAVDHPASRMLGPGLMRTEEQAAALIWSQLDAFRGRTPVWLVPSDRVALVQTMYAWGARNCELHVAQVRGRWCAPGGVVMPTFMPETG